MSWKSRMRIVSGDIAQMDTEAVVNAANNELWMGSGVAGVLKRVGGVSIEQEALRQAPIAVGEAIVTGAGNLPALNVIHAAAMSADRPATAEAVRAATLAALTLAAEKEIGSIAFPALGTGAGGLGFSDCAEAMLDAIREHCSASTDPSDIRIVLLGDNALQVFQRALEAAAG